MTDLAEIAQHHFQAVVEKRVEEIIDRYANSDRTSVFVEGPRWATLGFEQIAKGWRAFVDAPMSVESCRFVEGPISQVVGEMASIGGIVELAMRVREQIKQVRLRGTFVFHRQADGEWRIVHEHFSQPAADPYGIGDWLTPTTQRNP